MNPKILVSLLVIGLAAVAIGGSMTGAFFSDTETSTGNTFTAGSIDLKIDSECSWNGMKCLTSTDPTNHPGMFWNGDYTKGACTCAWTWKDLSGDKFFSFADIKPGDRGENTVSIHILNNDAWMCAKINNVNNNDNGCTEPEDAAGDKTCGVNEGELSTNLHFLVWADTDCDNVWDSGEIPLTEGDATPFLGSGKVYPIRDNSTGTGIPVPGCTDPNTCRQCIGVYWCAGSISHTENSGQPYTISCSGNSMGDNCQTDSLSADVTFYVVQARNNNNFVCSSWQ